MTDEEKLGKAMTSTVEQEIRSQLHVIPWERIDRILYWGIALLAVGAFILELVTIFGV